MCGPVSPKAFSCKRLCLNVVVLFEFIILIRRNRVNKSTIKSQTLGTGLDEVIDMTNSVVIIIQAALTYMRVIYKLPDCMFFCCELYSNAKLEH